MSDIVIDGILCRSFGENLVTGEVKPFEEVSREIAKRIYSSLPISALKESAVETDEETPLVMLINGTERKIMTREEYKQLRKEG